jgi:hypothetical protein
LKLILSKEFDMSIERVRELVKKGWDESIAILSQWSKMEREERELFSFEQLQVAYRFGEELGYGLLEIRELLMEKAQTHSQRYWVWITAPVGSNESEEAWRRLDDRDWELAERNK